MNRQMLKHLHLFSEKQQRYLKQSGLAKADDTEELPELKSRRKGSDEDAAAKMEEMMARCRNFVREKADTFEDRMREARQREEEAARRERLRREEEERQRLAF
eukprot:symbB.v1.2.011676.t1/scaffold785.1/size162803/13